MDAENWQWFFKINLHLPKTSNRLFVHTYTHTQQLWFWPRRFRRCERSLFLAKNGRKYRRIKEKNHSRSLITFVIDKNFSAQRCCWLVSAKAKSFQNNHNQYFSLLLLFCSYVLCVLSLPFSLQFSIAFTNLLDLAKNRQKANWYWNKLSNFTKLIFRTIHLKFARQTPK